MPCGSGCTSELNPGDGSHEELSVDTAVAVKLHDDLLATKPEGARHDADICPFCVEKAHSSTASRIPPGSAGPDVSDKTENTSTEGGTNPTMSDISKETHEALLTKAVNDAVKATEAALATKTTEAAEATKRVQELETANSDLKSDNDRLNKELDSAQVQLTSATEKATQLEQAAKQAEEDAKLAEIASKRADQVKNLKLFPDEYVSEKASKWAAFDEASWSDQLEEWKQLKPASTEVSATTETASAMTGTSEDLTKAGQQDAASADKPKARRAVLGL